MARRIRALSLPCIHVDDAARATVAAHMAKMLALQLPLSNQRARVELGWRPAFPTIRDGLAQTRAHAA